MVLPGALVYPMATPPTGLKAISFRYVPHAYGPGRVLGEGEDGPRYMVKLVWCDGDEWDDVVLPVDELVPDNDGPADPDGKLNPERPELLVFIDLGGAFRSGIENGPFVFEPLGEQTIWLDDLKLLSEDPSPEAPEVAENVTVLNRYDAPLMGAFIMGGEDRTVDYDDGEPDGECLKLTYALSGNTIVALAQPVALGTLKDAKSIRLTSKPVQTQLSSRWSRGRAEPETATLMSSDRGTVG